MCETPEVVSTFGGVCQLSHPCRLAELEARPFIGQTGAQHFSFLHDLRGSRATIPATNRRWLEIGLPLFATLTLPCRLSEFVTRMKFLRLPCGSSYSSVFFRRCCRFLRLICMPSIAFLRRRASPSFGAVRKPVTLPCKISFPSAVIGRGGGAAR